MYMLVSLHMETQSQATCEVTHLPVVPPEYFEPDEPLERFTLPSQEHLDRRERTCVVPADPAPGDTIVFDLPSVVPVGPNGAGYKWEAVLCEAYGPSHKPDPLLFKVVVPYQTHDDVAACEGAEVTEGRARKVGPRRFEWLVTADALDA